MSGGVGHRHGLDLALLWFWRRPVATAPIRPLPQEPSYATGRGPRKGKKTKKKKKKSPPYPLAQSLNSNPVPSMGAEIWFILFSTMPIT